MKKRDFFNNPPTKKVVTHVPHPQTSNCEPSALANRPENFIFLNIASGEVRFVIAMDILDILYTMSFYQTRTQGKLI